MRTCSGQALFVISVVSIIFLLRQHGTRAWSVNSPLKSRTYNQVGGHLQRTHDYVRMQFSLIHQRDATKRNIDELNTTERTRNDIEFASLVPQHAIPVKGMPTEVFSIEGNGAFKNIDIAEQTYNRGIATVGFITVLFASNSPALHSAFAMTSSENPPPFLLINAAVTLFGYLGIILTAPFIGKFVPDPSKNQSSGNEAKPGSSTFSIPIMNNLVQFRNPTTFAGVELGLWKTLGTTTNIWGLSQTSSDHGAFLIQLTTLIVPTVQGLSGVPIPNRIWSAIGLALGGVFVFTQDPNQSDCATLQGDLLCVLAAIFYATYDLRLFKWGKIVPTNELISTKMVTQSLLSLGLLFLSGRDRTLDFISNASLHDLLLVGIVTLWSGLAVNCLAPYLQVSGQQAVGPSRAQIIYASQPLWAAIMSFFLLGEQFGTSGLVGSSAFLGAIGLVATAELPNPNCPANECEV